MDRMLTICVLCLGLVLLGSPARAGTQGTAQEAVRIQLAQLVFCVPPEVWSKKRKRCVNAFKKIRKRCKSPRVWSSRQGRCVFPVADNPKCERNEVFSKADDACVCREGYERKDGACMQVAGLGSRPDYAKVQRCLNQLGFKAGRVDGQPGQRTRRALAEFRAEVGLRDRPARLNDPVTLTRLFEECDADKVEVAEEKKPEPDVQKKAEPALQPKAKAEADTAKSSQTGAYPELLCVSKGLSRALSKIAGGKLSVCGDACVPIPPGMGQKQIRQSEQEYAVKWCRNCIRIGDAGIVWAR